MKKKLLITAIALTLLLTSCGQEIASPTPAPITATSEAATSAPTVTATSEPDEGPIEPGHYDALRFKTPGIITPMQESNTLIDFDSDGDLDLIVLQFTEAPQVPVPMFAFRNDGYGNFTDASSEVFGETPAKPIHPGGYAVADFNGDGRDDLFLGEGGQDHAPFPGGQSLILIQSEDGQLLDETDLRLPEIAAFTHYVSAGDIDGDGDVDLYLANTYSKPYIGPRFWINDGDGFFTDDTTRIPNYLTNLERIYTASLLVDVDNDNDLDLVLGEQGESEGMFPSDLLLLNDGSGFFDPAPEDSLPPRIGAPGVGTVSMASGDFDNDGWPDLLMSTHLNYSDPTNMFLQLLLNNGDGTFRDESSRIDQDWPSYELPNCDGGYGDYWLVRPLVVDYNNDGWSDILVGSSLCIMHVLFENSGGESFEIVENLSEIGSAAFSEVNGWESEPFALVPGDVNGDDDLDIILLFFDYHLVLLRK